MVDQDAAFHDLAALPSTALAKWVSALPVHTDFSDGVAACTAARDRPLRTYALPVHANFIGFAAYASTALFGGATAYSTGTALFGDATACIATGFKVFRTTY